VNPLLTNCRKLDSRVAEISLSGEISALKDQLKVFGLRKITSVWTSLNFRFNTLEFMGQVVKHSLNQTKAIAQNLSLIIKLQSEYVLQRQKDISIEHKSIFIESYQN
jgi:hypothetical protein